MKMKKTLYLVLGIALLLSFGSVLYLIGNGYFIDYDDINNFEEMFESQDKDIAYTRQMELHVQLKWLLIITNIKLLEQKVLGVFL